MDQRTFARFAELYMDFLLNLMCQPSATSSTSLWRLVSLSARRFARAGPRSEPTTYEFVRLEGCFRSADACVRARLEAAENGGSGAGGAQYPAGLQLTRRARTRDDTLPPHINGNDIVRMIE